MSVYRDIRVFKMRAGVGQLGLPGVRKRPSRNGKRWGGRREGAGRKPKNGIKAGVAHDRRPAQLARVPVHVTVRLLDGIPRLRQRRGYQIAQRAVAMANRFEAARICHISIQHNHVHMIIEADDQAALTKAMRSFAICLARNVNTRLARRRGPVLADRYHVVALRTPQQVHAALAYVLGNWRRHGEDQRLAGPPRLTNRYSTGPYFTGWTTPAPPLLWLTDLPFPDDGPLPVFFPQSWLLREGWKHAGPLSPWHRPGPAARA